VRAPPESFRIMRLNTFSERAWAVVESPSGAIAHDLAGRLLIRLTREEALETASTRTREIRADLAPCEMSG
jgi:hypothetical protein